VKVEVWSPPLGPLDTGSWFGLLPGDDVSDWVGFFWHGVFFATGDARLPVTWFEVGL